MKKIMMVVISLITSVSTFAQTGKFITTKEGITDYVVVDAPNSDAKKIYDKTINWVSETYRNPSEVLTAKIENEKVIFNGSGQLSGGTNYVNYRVVVSIKDNKYKFEVDEIFIVGGAIGRYNYKQNLSQYFKSDGTPKPRLSSTISEIETSLNSLNKSLEMYINSTGSSKNNNW